MAGASSPVGSLDRADQAAGVNTSERREPLQAVDFFEPSYTVAESRQVAAERLRAFANGLPVWSDTCLRAFKLSVDGPYPPNRALEQLRDWWQELEHYLRLGGELPPDVPVSAPTASHFLAESLRLERHIRAAVDRFDPLSIAQGGTNVTVPAMTPPFPPPAQTGLGQEEKPPADPYAELRRCVPDLSKQELNFFEALCNALGQMPLTNVKALCEWQDPIESSWGSLRSRMNRKLEPYGWEVKTKGRVARLKKLNSE